MKIDGKVEGESVVGCENNKNICTHMKLLKNNRKLKFQKKTFLSYFTCILCFTFTFLCLGFNIFIDLSPISQITTFLCSKISNVKSIEF